MAEISAVRAVELCCGASICLKLHRSFLPLSHAHTSALKITLNCQPKRISGLMKSVIHYNKRQCNINTCRKNRLSTAPQQTLVLIHYNETFADHRKKSRLNSFKVEYDVHQVKFGPVKLLPNSDFSVVKSYRIPASGQFLEAPLNSRYCEKGKKAVQHLDTRGQ